jgi:hypothetical protein
MCLLDLFRLYVATDFGVVLKTHFGELKMRFLPNAAIHLVCYIRDVFHLLEGSKCVFHFKYENIRVHVICFKSYHHPNFDQLTRV